MNIKAHLKVDKNAFFRFIETVPEGRFEYDHGRIVQLMNGGTFAHMRIVQRFTSLFASTLCSDEWVVTSQGRGVDTGDTVRYPDVVVERAGAPVEGLSTHAPVIIVEVLSPSSSKLDLNVKPPEYLSIPSLETYIVAAQDEMECIVWTRADGRFPGDPVVHRDAALAISVPGTQFSLPLGDIYESIVPS